jgi:hypothetical protein
MRIGGGSVDGRYDAGILLGLSADRGHAISTRRRSETTGDAMVCLSYLDGSSRAHMRYMIRRLRRKLPNIKVLLGCWLVDGDAVTLGEAVKGDDVATTLRDAVRLCLEAARAPDHERKSKVGEAPTMRGSGARDLTEAAV